MPKKSNNVEKTLEERKKTHGDFTNHSQISQGLKEVASRGAVYETLNEVQREALEMILHKVARIVAGNPNHADNWHDIGGYAKLAEDRIK